MAGGATERRLPLGPPQRPGSRGSGSSARAKAVTAHDRRAHPTHAPRKCVEQTLPVGMVVYDGLVFVRAILATSAPTRRLPYSPALPGQRLVRSCRVSPSGTESSTFLLPSIRRVRSCSAQARRRTVSFSYRWRRL